MSKFAGKKVYVGMSGGVDSSVSAALLKEQGYDVTSVFIKVWQPDWISCTWKEDRLDAMRVCAVLNIPFLDVDLEEVYKKRVIDYMIEEYRQGKTPNPDVFCNTFVKFGAFYDWAMSHGADYVATGHYARVKEKGKMKHEKGEFELHAGSDSEKDQSYFLWGIKKEQLPHILFPVGGMKKSEVRKLAKKFGLPTAEKKDSQGLCFLGKIDVKEFLQHYIDLKEGNVINEKGEVIGTHPGALLFTIGERHGFSVGDKESLGIPLYVIAKDTRANTITVAPKPRETLGENEKVFLQNVNMLGEWSGEVSARIRYRAPLAPCSAMYSGETAVHGAEVTFSRPVTAVASGQSLVLYKGSQCVGGGIIDTTNY